MSRRDAVNQKKLRVHEIPDIKRWEILPFGALVAGFSVMGWFVIQDKFGDAFVKKYVTSPDDPHIGEELFGIVGAYAGMGLGAQVYLITRTYVSMCILQRSLRHRIELRSELREQLINNPLLGSDLQPQLTVKSRLCMQGSTIWLKGLCNVTKYSSAMVCVSMYRFFDLLEQFPKDNPHAALRDCWLIFAAGTVWMLAFELPKDFRDMLPFWQSRQTVRLDEVEPEQQIGKCANAWGTVKAWFR